MTTCQTCGTLFAMTDEEFIEFLEEGPDLSKETSKDKHIDILFENIFDILESDPLKDIIYMAQQIGRANVEPPKNSIDGCERYSQILEKVDIYKLDKFKQVSLLRLSFVRRKNISYWGVFAEKSFKTLSEQFGEKEAKDLLIGLV